MTTGVWLNDEMINFNMKVMQEREMKRREALPPRVHFFNTFFIDALCGKPETRKKYEVGYTYANVVNWNNLDQLGYKLLECEKLMIPVHQGTHWVLVEINLKEKVVRYMDSLKGRDDPVVKALLCWVQEEYITKYNHFENMYVWTREYPKNLPLQENGCDCGVFMLKYADYIARGSKCTV
jgi:sentrin-specific protease 1